MSKHSDKFTELTGKYSGLKKLHVGKYHVKCVLMEGFVLIRGIKDCKYAHRS